MQNNRAPAVVHEAGDDLLIAVSPSGHAVALDANGSRNSAPSPFELMLMGLGACTAADVISILRKKRERVTGYRVEVRSERHEEFPRALRRAEIRHLVRGHGLSEKAVADAIRLSDTKYCGVSASLRPGAEIVTSYEITEEA
jgi:putative redox protein